MIVVREVNSGEVVLRHRTALGTVNALAWAPDGAGLAVTGPVRDADAEPAVQVLSLSGSAVAGERLARVDGLPVKPAADSPLAAVATRCVWGAHGPLFFAVDDDGVAPFDATGRVLWADAEVAVGGFTADGRVLAVAGETIGVILLDALLPVAADGERPPGW